MTALLLASLASFSQVSTSFPIASLVDGDGWSTVVAAVAGGGLAATSGMVEMAPAGVSLLTTVISGAKEICFFRLDLRFR